MNTLAQSLDKRTDKTSLQLIAEVTQCVHGQLNDTALGFMRSVAKSNPSGLQKLLVKFQQLQLHIEASHIHLAIAALTEQINLPHSEHHSALHVIQTFLHNEDKKTLVNSLEALAQQHDSRLTQSVCHIMNNLNIFNEDNSEQQFMRLMMTLMIQWSTSKEQRTCKDAAKWLKSVLGVCRKSEMAQIINLVADHCHLSDCIILGKTRNMDGLELFFHLDNLCDDAMMPLVSEANKKMMADIHAVILAKIICQHSPNAFYDVVALHENHPVYSMMSTALPYQSEPFHLNQFFQNPLFFKDYFQLKDHSTHSNQQAFLCSFISNLHDTVFYSKQAKINMDLYQNMLTMAIQMPLTQPLLPFLVSYVQTIEVTDNVHKLRQCINLCHQRLNILETNTFKKWFASYAIPSFLVEFIQNNVLQSTYQTTLLQKNQNNGRIRASALQLVVLGFSHRSAYAITTGSFQPLVNTDIADIDVQNIRSLHAFCHQQSSEARAQLAKEMVLLTTLYTHNLEQEETLSSDHALMPKESKMQLLQQTLPGEPHTKYAVPKVFRANPLHRDRLFTHSPILETLESTNTHEIKSRV